MKTWIVLMFVTAVATAAAEKYDDINIDSVLKNDRLLNSYIKCILDKGPCTPEGRDLKTDLPDALYSNCAKCSARQKQTVKKAVRYLMKDRPQQWETIINKFDPDKKYGDRLNKFLNSE